MRLRDLEVTPKQKPKHLSMTNNMKEYILRIFTYTVSPKLTSEEFGE